MTLDNLDPWITASLVITSCCRSGSSRSSRIAVQCFVLQDIHANGELVQVPNLTSIHLASEVDADEQQWLCGH